MRYAQLGDVPAKRHVQFRQNGNAPDRGGPRLRGLLRQRVDPLPPAVALPRRARSATSSRSSATSGCPRRTSTGSPTRIRSSPAATGSTAGACCSSTATSRSRSASRPTERDGFYRNGEGDEVLFIHHGTGHRRDDLRRRPLPPARLRRDPARHDLPRADADDRASRSGSASTRRARSRRRTATATATGSCSSTRRTRSATSTRPRELHTHTDRGELRADGPGARRLPGLRPRLPPVRRRRLGRLRLSVHVQHRRLRADHGPHPHAAAGAPDVPGPELRDLLVLPARARLRPAGDRAALPPLERAVRGGDLLRRRPVRLAQGRRRRDDHPAPVGPAARPAAGPRRGVARRPAHRGAGGDVGHVPAAAADRRWRGELDKPEYALSWYEPEGAEVGAPPRAEEAGCSRRHSSTHRSPRATTATSPSTSPTTTRASTTRTTASAATRSPPRRSTGSPGSADPADRLHRGRARGLADRLPRARARSTSATRAARSARRSARSTCRATGSRSSTRSPRACEPLTGFEYVPAAGIVPLDEFYGSLADRIFHSTQYVRHHDAPLYTPEPDLIHEVIGHGHLLADPQVAEVNRLAGEAARRVRDRRRACSSSPTSSGSRSSSASCTRTASCAPTAPGILSSYGEIEEFRGDGDPPARLRARWRRSTTTSPTTSRSSSAAESMEHLVDAVGSFFAELRRRHAGAPRARARGGLGDSSPSQPASVAELVRRAPPGYRQARRPPGGWP